MYFFAEKHDAGIAMFALALYLSSFSLGMGPGAWLIPSEVFSTTIRAKAMSVTTFCNRITATIAASTFLTAAHLLTWAGFFLFLGFVSLTISALIWFYLPETKGKSLEDMSVYFAELTGDRTILDLEEKKPLRRHCKASKKDVQARHYEPLTDSDSESNEG